MISPGQFARLLERAAVRAHNELDIPTETLMAEAEREAKAAIGTYEFGWTQLAGSTRADRVRQGYPADEPLLRTGGLRDSITHEARITGSGAEGVVKSGLQVAIWQEFGNSRGIPPRPFLGPGLNKALPKAGEIFGAFAVKLLTFE